MKARDYQLNAAYVYETLNTTYLHVNYTFSVSPKVYEQISDQQKSLPNLEGLILLTDMPVGEEQDVEFILKAKYKILDLNYNTIPNFYDTLDFMIRKNKLTERPTYLESAPEPDLRPPPELIDMDVFANSTMMLKFNMKMKFKDDETDAQVIDDWLNSQVIIARVKAGVDGSLYQAN